MDRWALLAAAGSLLVTGVTAYTAGGGYIPFVAGLDSLWLSATGERVELRGLDAETMFRAGFGAWAVPALGALWSWWMVAALTVACLVGWFGFRLRVTVSREGCWVEERCLWWLVWRRRRFAGLPPRRSFRGRRVPGRQPTFAAGVRPRCCMDHAMDLKENWPQIRAAFDAGIRTSLHCAIATVGTGGYPHVTPIGFVFLRDDCTAFYFEEYTKRLPENLRHNPRVCLLLVNSGAWFWMVSLFRGRFATPPGVRLMGVAGERRLATEEERAAYRARVRPFKGSRGYELIWRDLRHVRDIRLEDFAPVSYPAMTDHLWR